jgi:HK97 family phage prohead protease
MTTSIHLRRLEGRVDRTADRIVDQARRQSGGGHIDPDALTNLRLPWYEVRADTEGRTVGQEEPATVLIYDEIGGSLGVQADQLVTEIQAITAPSISIRINSPGGSVFDAIAIHSALLSHPARVTTYVDAIAASAASIIAMAGDEVVMMPGSQMMIHDASALEDGNAADHGQMQTFLDRQSQNIAGMYARKAGGDPQDWRLLMLDETWAFAEESVELGLADNVYAARTHDPDAELMARRFDVSKYGYRYQSRREAPAPTPFSTTAFQLRRQERDARQARKVEVRERPAAPADAVQAALARRSALTRVNGHAETRGAATLALGTAERRLPFQSQMRSEQVERDGKIFYRVEGYASVYDTPYAMCDDFGPYDEIVVAGAGDATLAAKPHVVFLANHGGLALASTKNGTLELSNDRNGLQDIAWLNPERQDAKDLVLAIQDETIEEQSFAFYITDGVWNMDFTQFRIQAYDINRGDVSAVNYGANPHTSIAARQREIFAELRRMGPAQARAAALVLGGVADPGPVTPDVVSRLVAEEIQARMDQPKPTGTSLVHRWATLMSDESE